MRTKPKEKYEEPFAALKRLNAMLDPLEVTVDFKNAASEALKSGSPNANIKNCFFNLVQANWRKIQIVGLAKKYHENTDVRIVLKFFVALALVREDTNLGFQKLKESTAKMQNEKIAEFVS